MKQLFLIVFTIIISFSLAAQSDLVVQSQGEKLYLNHTVAAKENLYSIGRLYNISPREIAPFNGLTITSGLEINQVIKIPLIAENFVQRRAVASTNEVFIPLYHIVSEKEGLFRIGQNANKVSADYLKEWNGLSSENISVGQRLVVGFLKVKTGDSPLAATGSIKRIGGTVPASYLDASAPVAATSVPAVQKEPVVQAVNTNTTAENNTPAGGSRPATNTVSTTPKSTTDGAGFFKPVYQQQSQSSPSFRSESGNAAVFKSTSGWQDAKYYALMNNITPGTIVRITNPSNNRIIFAKVLGELPPGKENEGLLIRISNSAAAELRVNDKEPKFQAEVAYARG
ncbi:MAG: LysM peptidoglycan-binding domain-containing protein [Chitinophagaceae bacterium]|nr:LysM peptidoglycan-binding domain-containing protein [Chitinophagaceae bacterium]MCW5929750.1 LysM peptidoglycan-binding domain-containing protein [Chitinophagaceae bacterium]